MAFKDCTEEYNRAAILDEDAIRNDPDRTKKDQERREKYEEAARVKLREFLQKNPKKAEEWYRKHPEDRPQE